MPPQDSNHTEFTTEATDYALNVLATDLLATDPLAIDPLAIDPLAIESTPDIAIENDINDPGRDAEIVELEAGDRRHSLQRPFNSPIPRVKDTPI